MKFKLENFLKEIPEMKRRIIEQNNMPDYQAGFPKLKERDKDED